MINDKKTLDKHSPAPWTTDHKYGSWWLADANGNVIATIPTPFYELDEAGQQALEANKRLLQAAPELLAACEAEEAAEDMGEAIRFEEWPVVTRICVEQGISQTLDADDAMAALVDKAQDLRRTAIAKAKGQ